MSESGPGAPESALANAIAGKATAAAAREEAALEREFLGIRINNKRYAIPVDNVAEIVSKPTITRVPLLPGYVWGVFNRHGHACAVLDLAAFRGVEGEDDPKRFVVVFDPRNDTLEAAIPTTEVLGLIRVTEDSIDTGVGESDERGVITGYIQQEKLIAVLSTARLLQNARLEGEE